MTRSRVDVVIAHKILFFPQFPALSHVTSRYAMAIAETAGFR
jgi:hypothetical protein